MILSPKAIFLPTLRWGNSASFCNTVLTGRRSGGRSVMSLPSSRTRPSFGLSNPAAIRSKVVLPHPDGLSHEETMPYLISSLTRSTAVKSPKRLVIFLTRRMPCIFELPIVCVNLARDQAGEAITMARSAVELWL